MTLQSGAITAEISGSLMPKSDTLEAPFKSAHILNNKKDHRYCPDFPHPTNGKWLASAVFKYIDSKRVISQPPAATGEQEWRGVNRRVAPSNTAKIEPGVI